MVLHLRWLNSFQASYNPLFHIMNILLVGSGGREHTLAWKLKQSAQCEQLYIAPGNAGTQQCGTNLNISITDFEALSAACLEHNISMLIVGPEEPLVKGITDYFRENAATSHIYIIGPSAEAAQLEGSKAFAKAFMNKYHVPTAAYKEFTEENFEEGLAYIRSHPLPIVLKADGLAAGKGVLICNSQLEALAEFELMIMRSKFGAAGKKVVIEEFLTGIEMSVFVLTDGSEYVLLPEAKDYKRIGKGDTGLNTGGMGAVSPLPFFDEALKEKVISRIIEPTIQGLREEKMDYKGFVFVGLMVDNGEPMVIEYNCRMGDPETEVVIPRIKNDLVELLVAAANQKLSTIRIATDEQTAVAVVAVSGGYPGQHETGFPIYGLDASLPGSLLFHAGTKQAGDQVVTNGGRVLVATSFGDNVQEAAEQSEYLLQQVDYEDIVFRPDIGYEFRGLINGKA
ncbi:MAG: phosphoribosylamine--glycine ligase [Ferruginibacter sp.]|nr:phosphoribosylamine--glycine ligase [Ferruginibacter sp.]